MNAENDYETLMILVGNGILVEHREVLSGYAYEADGETAATCKGGELINLSFTTRNMLMHIVGTCDGCGGYFTGEFTKKELEAAGINPFSEP